MEGGRGGGGDRSQTPPIKVVSDFLSARFFS